jgi:sec-independent protein translocase protein TatC
MADNGAPDKDKQTMGILRHLEELRKVIIISLIAITIASIISFAFIEQIVAIITKPLAEQGIKPVYTAITEGIFTYFKTDSPKRFHPLMILP